MCKNRVCLNNSVVALNFLLVFFCSSAYSSEQRISKADCNVQIQGSNIDVDMSGCGKPADEKKGDSRLEVVEILTSSDSVLELGIRNSGDLIAFINGVQLVFGPMYCGSNVCAEGAGFYIYKYDVNLSNGKAEILHSASIEVDSIQKLSKENRLEHWKALAEKLDSVLGVKEAKEEASNLVQEPKYFEYLSPEDATEELSNSTTSTTITSYSTHIAMPYKHVVELHNLTIKKSPILRISKPVSPNEVTKLKIDLEFLDKFLYLSSCINTCVIKANAIVYYDSEKALKTTEFKFYFTNLYKNAPIE